MNGQETQEKPHPSTTCCYNCQFYESRSGFCRRNPPTPMQVFVKNIGYMPNSIYPKISLPAIDWCGEFKSKHVKPAASNS